MTDSVRIITLIGTAIIILANLTKAPALGLDPNHMIYDFSINTYVDAPANYTLADIQANEAKALKMFQEGGPKPAATASPSPSPAKAYDKVETINGGTYVSDEIAPGVYKVNQAKTAQYLKEQAEAVKKQQEKDRQDDIAYKANLVKMYASYPPVSAKEQAAEDAAAKKLAEMHIPNDAVIYTKIDRKTGNTVVDAQLTLYSIQHQLRIHRYYAETRYDPIREQYTTTIY